MTAREKDARRVLRSTVLSKEEVDALEGATIFDPEDLDRAIIATMDDEDGVVAVYEYDKLCQCFYDDGDPDSTWEGAMEWVDYNLVRALAYMKPRAPVIVMRVESPDTEEYGEDAAFYTFGDFQYVEL